MEDGGLDRLLKKPIKIQSKRGTRSSFNGMVLRARKVDAAFTNHGVMVKLPGEEKEKTGILTVRVVSATGIPADVHPIVIVKKTDKHLNHGGCHVEKSTATGARALNVDNPFADDEESGEPAAVSAPELEDEVKWDEDGATLQYQVNEHSKQFYFRMYDSSSFEEKRWTATGHVSLEDIQAVGNKGGDPGDFTVTLKCTLGDKAQLGGKVQLQLAVQYVAEAEGVPNWQFLQVRTLPSPRVSTTFPL